MGVIIKAVIFSFLDNISIIGIQKAAVLPVPVCAEPRISNPFRATGIAFCCIGVGMEKSILSNALLKFLERPKLSKLFINFSLL